MHPFLHLCKCSGSVTRIVLFFILSGRSFIYVVEHMLTFNILSAKVTSRAAILVMMYLVSHKSVVKITPSHAKLRFDYGTEKATKMNLVKIDNPFIIPGDRKTILNKNPKEYKLVYLSNVMLL